MTLLEKIRALKARIVLAACCFGVIVNSAGLGIVLNRHQWGYVGIWFTILVVWCWQSAKELKLLYQEKKSEFSTDKQD